MDCNITDSFLNGFVYPHQPSENPKLLPRGDCVSFVCRPGFTLTGPREICCLSGGRLSESLPFCASRLILHYQKCVQNVHFFMKFEESALLNSASVSMLHTWNMPCRRYFVRNFAPIFA